MNNKTLLPFAKALRKNMTNEERRLWYAFLRTYPVKFLRQKIIGKYIVDFYCAKAKLIVELDGSQHYDAAAEQKDAERTEFLKSRGLQVVRISNYEFNRNFKGVCEWIDLLVKERLT